jgi:molecular chaperone HtpG
MSDAQTHSFQAEVSQVLKLVVNSLYSHKEVFLRELVSNASDALDKLRFRALSEPDLMPEGTELRIRIIPNDDARTLTISDNGIGMSEQDLKDHLGTIARSGTKEFLAKLEEAKAEGNPQLIGQFGVGFYSAFLVADRVDVVTRAAGSDVALRWSSDAKESYTIEPAERDTQGTDVILHLSAEHAEFLQGYRLRDLVSRYSDYLAHPIEMPKVRLASEKGEAPQEGPEFDRINQEGALWQKSPKDVTEEQYAEFYKHLSHDWEKPLSHRHFHVEGTQMFKGILFLPKRPPFDLFEQGAEHGVRLHVRRVFVMDNCEELVPKHLRFLKGLVDSEDLPLNVSRELLQDSRAVQIIKKQVTNHALSMLEELATDRAEDYKGFWKSFGPVLKEGLHYGVDDLERYSKLLRYRSSSSEFTSLAEYVSRMKEGQTAIYYAAGLDLKVLESSPHLEGLKKLGYEVLYMTDAVDPFAMSRLQEFEGKAFKNAMEEKLDLSEKKSEEEKQQEAAAKEASGPLLERFKQVLSEQVSEVRASDRLFESPVCLVTPEGGVAPHIERLMRAHNQSFPESKRILEVNPGHPVIENLKRAHEADGASTTVADWIALLYDQALIAEGSPLPDPGAFSRRLSQLMGRATV